MKPYQRRVRWLSSALGTLLVIATLLPLIPSNEWWIRLFDFPRVQIAALIGVLMLAMSVVGMWRTRRGLLLMVALAFALAYQFARIAPYTSLYPEQVPGTKLCAVGNRIRYMEANVLQHNRSSAKLMALVGQFKPDILLLTETDPWWADQLRPLGKDFPHEVSVPLANTYGMMLLSRWPLIAPDIRYLLEPGVPSIRTAVALPSGLTVDLYGVHPRPPRPGQDTAERDAELVMVGREVRRRKRPTIVAGDLNDVAWSDTTSLFQKVSGLLDPRVGRKLMPTFPADLPLLRWPLDYVFVSPGFSVIQMWRLPDVGSDHLPIIVDLCAAGLPTSSFSPAVLKQELQEDATEIIREGREEASE